MNRDIAESDTLVVVAINAPENAHFLGAVGGEQFQQLITDYFGDPLTDIDSENDESDTEEVFPAVDHVDDASQVL